jgi:hypothetical protein
MITEEEINNAFCARREAFDKLAEAEDEATSLKKNIDEVYKVGSDQHAAATKRLASMQPILNAITREYRYTEWEINRIDLITRLNF